MSGPVHVEATHDAVGRPTYKVTVYGPDADDVTMTIDQTQAKMLTHRLIDAMTERKL